MLAPCPRGAYAAYDLAIGNKSCKPCGSDACGARSERRGESDLTHGSAYCARKARSQRVRTGFKATIVGLRCKKSAFAELSCLTVLQRRGLRGSTLLRDDSPLMSDNGGLPRELPRPRTSGAHFPLLPCGGLSPCVPLSAARNKEYSSPLSACLILQYILVCIAVFILQYPQADVNRFGCCPSAHNAQARRIGRLVR